ncbi:N-acetylmuramoyl-L-alanine amidase [Candidatus Dependentiae bacterium]
MMFIKTLVLLTLILFPTIASARFSIMLDPAGDAKHTGRQIGDSLERGITLQFAEKLKKKLEKYYPDIRVILTRFPGETIYPLQNANFSNRLDVDFYLSIHFFPETKTKPDLFLYYFSYSDEFVTRVPEIFFCPYDQAHRINGATTRSCADAIAQVLTNDGHKKLFNVNGVLGLPFKPLIGVKAPAVAIEIGLKEKTDWKRYVKPIARSLEKVVTQKG